MNRSLRQKKVASLVKNELSRLFVDIIPDCSSSLISITRVEMSKDLKTAYVYLSFFGESPDEPFLELLNTRKGYLRKSIASNTNLKYNPQLIFSLDRGLEFQRNIDDLINKIKKDEK